jgi:type VI secretion system protein ImpF
MVRSPQVDASQSVWDRLSETQERPGSSAALLRMLKESIRRDLEELLNTRRLPARELRDFPIARSTVFNYGLEDLSSLTPGSSLGAEEVQRAVQRCLAEYEPRLTDVRVTVVSAPLARREMLLHIEAVLPVQPAAELVVFDTMLDLTSGMYSVS